MLSHIMAAVLHSLLAAELPNLMTPLSLCYHPVAKPHDCGVAQSSGCGVATCSGTTYAQGWDVALTACSKHTVNCQCVVQGYHMHINFTEHTAYIQHAYVRKSIRTAGIAYRRFNAIVSQLKISLF